ncbi:MAG: HAD family hydrolase [Candidatus Helarchaeota archaeon]
MIKGIIFDFDETLTSENSITFLMKWQVRRYFESEKYFNPFFGFFDIMRIFFYGLRYERHMKNLFSKKCYNKPIEEVIIDYGKFVSKYYPYILKSLKNISKEDIAKSSKHILLRPGVKDMLIQIKNKNILLGICSMSIEIAPLSLLDFVNIDYTACNNLIYQRKLTSSSTGDSMLSIRNAIDKKNVVLEFSKIFNLHLDEIAYVGDDLHDFLAADIAGVGLILLNSQKINKKNILFYKKGKKYYNFDIIWNITDVLNYIF